MSLRVERLQLAVACKKRLWPWGVHNLLPPRVAHKTSSLALELHSLGQQSLCKVAQHTPLGLQKPGVLHMQVVLHKWQHMMWSLSQVLVKHMSL